MAASNIFGPALKAAGRTPFARYQADIQIVDKMIGGIPKDPDTIKAWLASRLAVEDRILVEMAETVAAQMEQDTGRIPVGDELLDEVARQFTGGNGFKTVDGQLVYEGRCAKAALREAANVAFPGTAFPGKSRLGQTAKGTDAVKKGLWRLVAECVFVEELYIPLGVAAPAGTEQRIKRVKDQNGERSVITVVDYVEKPAFSFTVKVLYDFMVDEVWGAMWELLEQIGFGSDRARSDGKFDLVGWTRLT